MNELGELIRRNRKLKKMTLKDLSIKVGIGINHLSNIERGKKGVSHRTLAKLIKHLGISNSEISKILKSEKNEKNKLTRKKKELEEKELELINTYDFIRETNSELSKQAAINRILINFAKQTEELMVNLELILEDTDYRFLKKINRPIKNTINIVENRIDRLKKYNIEETKNIKGEDLMDISNLTQHIPMASFTKDQIRSGILTWVAEDLKFKLKDYNIEGCPGGFSRRLWGAGRGTEGKRGYMEDIISSNVKLNTDGSSLDELEQAQEELALNLIDNSLIVLEDLLKAARNAKTEKVRKKYLMAMNNKEFLLSTLQLSIVLYSQEMLRREIDIKHDYLTIRLQAVQANKKILNSIWISFANNEISLDEAQERTTEIMRTYEEKVVTDQAQIGRIANEKLVYNLLGEERLKKYLYELTDSVAQSITGKIRLIPISQI